MSPSGKSKKKKEILWSGWPNCCFHIPSLFKQLSKLLTQKVLSNSVRNWFHKLHFFTYQRVTLCLDVLILHWVVLSGMCRYGIENYLHCKVFSWTIRSSFACWLLGCAATCSKSSRQSWGFLETKFTVGRIAHKLFGKFVRFKHQSGHLSNCLFCVTNCIHYLHYLQNCNHGIWCFY